jgi:hypothetical protein
MRKPVYASVTPKRFTLLAVDSNGAIFKNNKNESNNRNEKTYNKSETVNRFWRTVYRPYVVYD